MAKKMVKLTVNLSQEVIDAVEELAERVGCTRTEVLRRAIGTHKYMMDEVRKGNKILIEDKQGKLREVIFQ